MTKTKKIYFTLIFCTILACLTTPVTGEPEIMGSSKFYGEKYAILVGIEDYSALGDLECCDDDARDMRSLLLDSQCGFSYSNIELLLNSQATRNNIRDAIEEIASKAGEGDLVVFYFSGHGSYGEDLAPYDEYSDGLDEYICPYDSRYSGKVNYIRDDELEEWFDAIESDYKLLIFDSCYSGGMSKTAEPGLTSGSLPKSDFMRDFLESKNLETGFAEKDAGGSTYLVLAACRENEESSAGTPNSVFTYFLLRGFRSDAADVDSDGWISAEEAFSYAEPRTVNFVDANMPERPMHPQIYDGSSREIELVCKGGTIPTTIPTTVPTTQPTASSPDLVATSVVPGTTTPAPGERILVTATVQNTGGGYALSSTTTLYLSSDQSITSGDTYLGYIPIGVLPGGQSSSGRTWVTIPSNVGPGVYYIGVVADGSNTVSESNENNNANYASIQISGQTPVPTTVPTTQPTWIPTTVPTTIPSTIPTTPVTGPDLVVHSVTLGTTSPDPGQQISVNAWIRNEGSGYAMPSQAYVYLSHDTTISPLDTYLGSIRYGILMSGRSSSGTGRVTIPSNVGPGVYYIGVVADGSNTVAESNENNNVDYASIQIGGQPTTVPTTYPTAVPTTPQTGCIKETIGTGSISSGEDKYYSVNIPQGLTSVTFTLDGTAGQGSDTFDQDLYVKKYSKPYVFSQRGIYDYKSATSSVPDEEIFISNPMGTTYYILVKATAGSGSFTLSMQSCL